MAVSSIKETFSCSVQEIWDIVTSLENYQWRSDLSKIEVISEMKFVEYTKDEYSTEFTVTACEPCRRWEFDMENSNMKGHWTGVFKEMDGLSEIEFTEEVTAKKLLMKPFVGAYLKKQQERYVADLRRAVEKLFV